MIYIETRYTNFLEWSQLGCLPIRNLLPCHWIRTNITKHNKTKQNDRFSAKKPTHTRYWFNRQQHMCYIVGATTDYSTDYIFTFVWLSESSVLLFILFCDNLPQATSSPCWRWEFVCSYFHQSLWTKKFVIVAHYSL